MTYPFNSETVARITKSDPAVVEKNYPLILDALHKRSIVAIQPVVATLATVGVECHFVPRQEMGDAAYFKRMYGDRPDYEVDAKGLWKWRGRGYVQLSTLPNYQKYGVKIGIDLVKNPDALLDPHTAALVLVEYMLDHGCFTWASRGSWDEVRRLVNGGLTHFEEFLSYVWPLQREAYAPPKS